MDAREAAEFLRLSYEAFRKIAPSVPRHRLGSSYRYLRSELLEWLREGQGIAAERRERVGARRRARPTSDASSRKRDGKVRRLYE